MRESLMYGSVRGARGNSRPYRDEGAGRKARRDPAGASPAQVRPSKSAWKRVLREAAVTPNTKRTQRLRGVCD